MLNKNELTVAIDFLARVPTNGVQEADKLCQIYTRFQRELAECDVVKKDKEVKKNKDAKKE